jgi:hypothetical protein
MGQGGKWHENYLVVKLEENFNLGAREVDTTILVGLRSLVWITSTS